VYPKYELWFEVSEIDLVERNGNTFILREMHTYSVSDRILTSLELPQINKLIGDKEKRYQNRSIAFFLLHVCVMITVVMYIGVGLIDPLLPSNHQNHSNQTTMLPYRITSVSCCISSYS